MGPNFFMAVGFVVFIAILLLWGGIEKLLSPAKEEPGHYFMWQRYPFDDPQYFKIVGDVDELDAQEKAQEVFDQKVEDGLTTMRVFYPIRRQEIRDLSDVETIPYLDGETQEEPTT